MSNEDRFKANAIRGLANSGLGFLRGVINGNDPEDEIRGAVNNVKQRGQQAIDGVKNGIKKVSNAFSDDADFDNNGKASDAEKSAAKMVDTDRDGKVDFSEKSTRRWLDFNEDGKITSDEVGKARAADTNRDGKISKDERNNFQDMDKNDDGVISKSERSGQKAKERDEDDKKRSSSGKSQDGDNPSWYQRNVQGMEHKPVKSPDARDFNEDGKVDRTERGAYNSLQDLQKSGKMNSRDFNDAVENLHDKCRGQDSSVAATQVRGGQGQGHSNGR